MPEMDGLAVCREARAGDDTPIVFLTSRDEELDRVLGLELGADDYLTKPFSPRELVARVNAVLRRTSRTRTNPPKLPRHGSLTLDPERHQCWWETTEVDLTVTEFSLLQALLGLPGKAYTRAELVDRAYGLGHFITDRTIDSHVRRIRRKLSEVGAGEIIETVHGLGYRMRV